MAEYIQRNIDSELTAWKEDSMRKPLLLLPFSPYLNHLRNFNNEST